jgi:hypothetical protein
MRDRTPNFCEVDFASGVCQCDNRDKGVQCQPGDDVCLSRCCREHREIEQTSVSRLHLCAVGESRNKRLVSWLYVDHRSICGQEVAGGSGVKDGPGFDGGMVNIDCLKERGCGKSKIGGGGG